MADWTPTDQFGWPVSQWEASRRLRFGSVADKVRLHRQLREGLPPPASKAEDDETKQQGQEEEK